ncbi:hypothetical protein NPIL_66471 [Nephila pilipes]|uniref:Uncharacterized protein n=1 Tax=Nephila pilipes TaxID=299642 RepID=A0A8X6U9Y8_NEPPI|nr:hypothetical protein NPIL_66471 [Nephila pilipes]
MSSCRKCKQHFLRMVSFTNWSIGVYSKKEVARKSAPHSTRSVLIKVSGFLFSHSPPDDKYCFTICHPQIGCLGFANHAKCDSKFSDPKPKHFDEDKWEGKIRPRFWEAISRPS